ncbi:MAG: hypothetical protein IM651_07230, partial [Phenylobacterium sp.]|nr:hypothetical protein [Phenylobacterium sp.]
LNWLRAAARGETPDPAALTRAAVWLAGQKALYGDLVSPVSADRAVARTALADAEGRAAWLEQNQMELERTLNETQAIVERLGTRLEESRAAIREAAGRLDGLLAGD